jgi:hypothetical protein
MAASNGGIGGFLASGGIDLFVGARGRSRTRLRTVPRLAPSRTATEGRARGELTVSTDIATLLSLSKEEPEWPVSPTDPVGHFMRRPWAGPKAAGARSTDEV